MQWILLPGLDGTGMLFAPFLRVLPADIVPVVIRYPSDRICSSDELVDIVLSSLPDGEPYILIAESFSGPIGLRALASHARQPRALVLCASFAKCPVPSVVITMLKIVAGLLARRRPAEWLIRRYLIGEAPEDVLALFYAAIGRVSPNVLADRFALLAQLNGAHQSEEMKSPVLYLQATRDRLVGGRHARLVQRLYPDTWIERIDSPHLILQVQPHTALQAILRFLDQRAPA